MLQGLKQTDDGEPWIVSYWYIPGGWDYVNAQACVAFFDSEELARRVAAEYDMVPEMAFAMSREQYEKGKKVAAETLAYINQGDDHGI